MASTAAALRVSAHAFLLHSISHCGVKWCSAPAFYLPSISTSRQDVTGAVVTRRLSRQLCKLLFIVSHRGAIKGGSGSHSNE